MTLTSLYAAQIAAGLAAAVNVRALAQAWLTLRPGHAAAAGTAAQATPAAVVTFTDPAASALLGRARQAIAAVLARILPAAWTEGWTLGQQSARAVVTLEPVDWAAWKPGDVDAARAVAEDGLRQLLDEADVRIQSIAVSRVGDLAEVLSHALQQGWSVDQLEAELRGVLDDPSRARMVAHTEIARAQTAGARATYAERDVAEVEILTAADQRVCPICEAAEAHGPWPLDQAPGVPLHPLCRCAEVPAVAADLKLVGAS